MAAPGKRTQLAFNTGEVTPVLAGRTDVEKVSGGCRTLQNMTVDVSGAAVRRAGLQFIGPVKGTDIETVIPPSVDFSINDTVFDIIRLGNTSEFLIAGVFTEVNGEEHRLFARFDADDPSVVSGGFSSHTGGAGVLAMGRQSTGKVIVGGSFTSLNGGSWAHVARLNADGTLDGAFPNNASSAPIETRALVIQSDDKIVLANESAGGTFLGVVRAHGLARLNADGTLDTGFDPDLTLTGGSGAVNIVAIQSDGKILCDLFLAPTDFQFAVIRLNTDGSIDNSWTITPLTNANIEAIIPLPDGRVVVAQNDGLRCLTSAGGLDSGFGLVATSHTDPTALKRAMALDLMKDGKLIAGGEFNLIGGHAYNGCARVATDGTVDTTWQGLPNQQLNRTSVWRSISDSASGGYGFFAGAFTEWNGVTRLRFCRTLQNGALL